MSSPSEDRVHLGVAAGGAVRWVAADLGAAAEEARRRLDLSPVAAAALGRTLTGAVLLRHLAARAPLRVVVEVRGDGPLGSVVAEVDRDGNVRGTVGEPRVDLPAGPGGKLAVGRAVGKGLLRVWRQHGDGRDYQSQVELVSGEIGVDFAHYLQQSEQARAAVALGVLTRPAGVVAAGGLVVEALPGVGDDVVARLEERFAALTGPSRVLEGGGLAALVDTILGELAPETRERAALRYHCRCSRDGILRHLAMLSPDERQHLLEDDGVARASCVFCGELYEMAADEIAAARRDLGSP